MLYRTHSPKHLIPAYVIRPPCAAPGVKVVQKGLQAVECVGKAGFACRSRLELFPQLTQLDTYSPLQNY